MRRSTGGVEFGEPAELALRREIMEELGAGIEEPQLLGVLENLFEYAGRPKHEIVFVFDAQFSDREWYGKDELTVTETGTEWEAARWISIEALLSGPEPLVPHGLLPLLQSGVSEHSAINADRS